MTTRRVVPLLLFALPCIAQVPVVPLPHRGAMPALQAGILFSHDPATIHRKPVKLGAAMETFLPGRNSPEYAVGPVAAALIALVTSMQPPPTHPIDIKIDAMSSGNDFLPASYNPTTGCFEIGLGNVPGWASLALVVTGEGGATAADVYGYYFDNPQFPLQLRSAMYHELLRADHVMPDGGPLPPQSAIQALDINMGLIESANGFPDARILPVTTKMYFSLTPASAQTIELTGYFAVRGPIDGATIFVANYDQSSGTLLSVDVHATGSELGLPPEYDDIDALGVAYMAGPGLRQPGRHHLAGSEFFYVVSFGDGIADAEELQVIATTQDPQPSLPPPVRRRSPLRTMGGMRLVGPGGLNGRVKGLCGTDPESTTGGHSLGVPADQTPANLSLVPTMSNLNFSVTAEGAGAGSPHDSFVLSGILTGSSQQPPTLVALWMVGGDHTFFLIDGFWANPSVPYPMTRKIDFPWDTTPATLGNAYEVQVLTIGASGLSELSHRSLLLRHQF